MSILSSLLVEAEMARQFTAIDMDDACVYWKDGNVSYRGSLTKGQARSPASVIVDEKTDVLTVQAGFHAFIGDQGYLAFASDDNTPMTAEERLARRK